MDRQLPRPRPLTIDDERNPSKEVRIEISTLKRPNSRNCRQRLNGTGEYSTEDDEDGQLAIQARITMDASDVIRNDDGTVQTYHWECLISINDSPENCGAKGRLIGENSSVRTLEFELRRDFVGGISETLCFVLGSYTRGLCSVHQQLKLTCITPPTF